MQIKEIDIKDIHPYEKNPRRNDDAVDKVAESIEQFGFKVPIVIDKNNIIVAGHTRYKAAQKLGLEVVPCIIADDLTDQQVKAFRLADNKVSEFSEWDMDLLGDELDDIFDIDMSAFGFDDIEDHYEDIDDEKNGDTTSFEHRLKCGKIDVVLTQDEYEKLLERFNKYVYLNGVSFGFVQELLKND